MLNTNILESMNSLYEIESLPFISETSHPNVTMFPVAKGEDIKPGDFVVVHKKRKTAYKPKEYMGRGFMSVGQAVLIGERDKKKYVVCRDGIFTFINASDPLHRISPYDKECYFVNGTEVSGDCRDTSVAGKVCGTYLIEGYDATYDAVFVYINAYKALGIEIGGAE